jgi:hypothetical protein
VALCGFDRLVGDLRIRSRSRSGRGRGLCVRGSQVVVVTVVVVGGCCRRGGFVRVLGHGRGLLWSPFLIILQKISDITI